MKNFKLVQIAKKLKISHSAVSQWFNGVTTPTCKHMFEMRDNFGIPLEAWADIKSFISKNIATPKN
jgi:transcriptional regulator with XRE-family HTH domain